MKTSRKIAFFFLSLPCLCGMTAEAASSTHACSKCNGKPNHLQTVISSSVDHVQQLEIFARCSACKKKKKNTLASDFIA